MIKIVLNASALTKLIEDGGEEFHLQISQAALNEAAHRLLTAVTPDEVLRKVKPMVQKEVEDQLGEWQTISTHTLYGSTKSFVLKDDIQKTIKQSVEGYIRELIKEYAEGDAIRQYAKEKAETEHQLLKIQINRIVSQMVTNTFVEDIKKAVNQKLATLTET